MRELAGKARKVWASVGPYVLIEALMPGGTLLALGLYFYRRRKAGV
jgi:hypothetical protein